MTDLQRYFQDKWDVDGATEKLYLTHDITADSIVFDIGGYTGEWAAAITRKYDPHIYVFEPIKEFHAALERRFIHSPKVRVFPFGLASSANFAKIYKWGAASSLYREQGPFEDVEFRRVTEGILDALGLDYFPNVSIDLISINIEGGEYDLLPAMIEQNVAWYCREIQVQFHPLWPSCYDQRNAIRKLLAATHDERYSYPFVWDSFIRRMP